MIRGDLAMESKPTPPPPKHQRVPEDLIQQLDEANIQFHEGKEHLEAELDSFEPDRQHRLDRRRAELQEAERRLEEVSKKIHENIQAKDAEEDAPRGGESGGTADT
jgi:hypothetical protein